MAGVVVLAVALVASVGIGLWFKARDGQVKSTDRGSSVSVVRLDAQDLGTPLGDRASFVHFSSAFCAPCRATRVLVDKVAGEYEGVRVVEIDAEDNLALVRRLDIRRTPTVLVLDAEGEVRRRASGLPKQADLVAALGEVV